MSWIDNQIIATALPCNIWMLVSLWNPCLWHTRRPSRGTDWKKLAGQCWIWQPKLSPILTVLLTEWISYRFRRILSTVVANYIQIYRFIRGSGGVNDATCSSAENMIGLRVSVYNAVDLKIIFDVNKKGHDCMKNLGHRAMSINPGIQLNSAC